MVEKHHNIKLMELNLQWFKLTTRTAHRKVSKCVSDSEYIPEMSGAVPHHLLLLQGQSFNHAFAVIDKLTVQSFLH